MNIRIWDSHNEQWLEPVSIFFGKESTIWRVTACKEGEDPLTDGWYDLQGEDLEKISIVGDISFNAHLLPSRQLEARTTCSHEFVIKEYPSQSYGTCASCGLDIFE